MSKTNKGGYYIMDLSKINQVDIIAQTIILGTVKYNYLYDVNNTLKLTNIGYSTSDYLSVIVDSLFSVKKPILVSGLHFTDSNGIYHEYDDFYWENPFAPLTRNASDLSSRETKTPDGAFTLFVAAGNYGPSDIEFRIRRN